MPKPLSLREPVGDGGEHGSARGMQGGDCDRAGERHRASEEHRAHTWRGRGETAQRLHPEGRLRQLVTHEPLKRVDEIGDRLEMHGGATERRG